MKSFRTFFALALTLTAPASLFVLATGTAVGQTQQGSSSSQVSQQSQVPLVFSGGHETDPQDRGRPVILIAGALGVPPQVFRTAFRQVRPARAGTEPEPAQVRQNKSALMAALRPYGVTNERLDTVSNYYRYVRSRNESWPVKAAVGYAVVQNGIVLRYVITDGGSGYSSPPQVTIKDLPGATGTAQIAYGPAFDRNGSVSSVVVAPVVPRTVK
jgi:hypothetical protein